MFLRGARTHPPFIYARVCIQANPFPGNDAWPSPK